MEIVVQLSPEAAASFKAERAPPDQGEVVPGLTELGLSLEPMHPGESDPTLSSYFTASVPDQEAARQAIETLNASDAVQAAYVKPPAELP